MILYKPMQTPNVVQEPIRDLTMTKFIGADFSSSQTLVELYRSPEVENLYSIKIGDIGKRTGFKNLINRNDFISQEIGSGNKEILGIHKIEIGTFKNYIVHYGGTGKTGTYRLYDEDWENGVDFFGTAHATQKSVSFQFGNDLYILDGRYFTVFRYENGTVSLYSTKGYSAQANWLALSTIAYIPTVTINRTYNGASYDLLEAENLLVSIVKDSFEITDKNTQKTLTLSKDYIDETPPFTPPVLSCQYLNTLGVWSSFIDFTFNTTTKKVEVTAYPIDLAIIAGQDNFIVTHGYEWEYKNANIISARNIYDIFTVGVGNYVFIGGEADLTYHPNENLGTQNLDYVSFVNNPLYFPADKYAEIGQSNGAITGYLKLGNNQVILKEKNGNEPTIYLRQLIDVDTTSFSITQGLNTSSALSKYAIQEYNGEALFLSENGIDKIQTNNVTEERNIQNLSFTINKAIKQETNKDKAILTVFDDNLILSYPSGNLYITDVTKSNVDKFTTFNWFKWTNIEANCFFVDSETLYFGTKNGDIMEFRKDTDVSGYYDVEYNEDTTNYDNIPVISKWVTPVLDFGDISRYKTLNNFYIMLDAYARSGVEIYYRVKSIDTLAMQKNVDVFDFRNIDFTRFTFETDLNQRVYSTGKKQKKFMLIQFKIMNSNGEPFSFSKIQIKYKYGGRYKK